MLSAVERCKDCGSFEFFHDKERGEVLCRKCGAVLEEAMVDFGKDTRSFEEDDSNEGSSRTGAPFDPRISNNLATTIGNNTDISRLSGKNKTIINRIKKRQSWAMTSFEHSINLAMNHMRLISSKMNLPTIVEKEAAMIYRRASEKRLTLKRAIEDIVISSLFIACKLHNIPRSMKEFIKVSKRDMKIMGKTYKLLVRNLNLKIVPTSPSDYVTKFASALRLSARVQSVAVKMIDRIRKNGSNSGLNPLSVVASCLYIASLQGRERRTQKEVAETTGITEATLRAVCKRVSRELGIKLKIR